MFKINSLVITGLSLFSNVYIIIIIRWSNQKSLFYVLKPHKACLKEEGIVDHSSKLNPMRLDR